jgi:transposase-like protein
MSRRKKIRDELEARRCLLAVESEGGNIGTWARAHGIDGRSLRAWQVNLARRGTKASGPRRRRTQAAQVTTTRGLVELVPTALARTAPSSSRSRYVLEVGGARVEFGDDFSEPTLRRIVGVLRSC